jgi:hypothetical protein
MKQELANKLEIARSSYTVIQKTLMEISKIVQPSSTLLDPNQILMNNQNKQQTDDDWDESSRPKFLNNE